METPLSLALVTNIKMVSVLIKNGADPNQIVFGVKIFLKDHLFWDYQSKIPV